MACLRGTVKAMGLRGPPPKPTAIRILEGNRSKRALPVGEPQPRRRRPVKPPLSEAAGKLWGPLTAMLLRMNVLTEADGIVMGMLCESYATLLEAQQSFVKTGLIIKSPSGNIQQNPLLGIINRKTEQVQKLCREFGLSPTSRVRLATGELGRESSDDGLLDFIG